MTKRFLGRLRVSSFIDYEQRYKGRFPLLEPGKVGALDHNTGGEKGSMPNGKVVRVFIGPSLEGGDVEYVERVSGKISNRKPSFAR